MEIAEQGKEKVSFQYNAAESRSAMYYGDTTADKLQRRYRKFYSEDGSMEIVNDMQAGSTNFVFYLGGDAYSAPAIWKEVHTSSDITQDLYYLHRDHLGSILMITDNQGEVKEKRQFDAWGNIVKLTDGNGNVMTAFVILDRGYTGHEHLFGVALINMNARLYDPALHRFLSPDNFMQDPSNTQNFNRYGYVMNNPLVRVDKDGNFFFVPILIGAAVGILTNGISNAVHDQPFFQGAFKSGLIGGIGGAFSFGIGQAVMGMSGFGQIAVQTLAHGYLGGVMSGMNGGSFGQGFLSGAFGSLGAAGTGALLQNASRGIAAAGMLTSGAVLGGIGAELEGGNFWDGARNGAISAGLNHVTHMLMDDHKPVPKEYKKGGLPGFEGSEKLKHKDGTRPSWDLGKGKHGEWDFEKGEVEVYDKQGNHQGGFDPETGRQISKPVPNRQPTYRFQGTNSSFDLRNSISTATGLTGAGLTIYLIISEGSRLFPPRNLVPIP